jgi:flagellar hook-basal body complex protein FliE
MTAPIGGIGQGLAALREVGETGGIKVPVTGTTPTGAPSTGAPDFGELFKRAINQVSDAQETSKDYVAAFVRGEPVELHQVMAASEEAGIAIDLLIQVRNKFLDAYKTVLNMQA